MSRSGLRLDPIAETATAPSLARGPRLDPIADETRPALRLTVYDSVINAAGAVLVSGRYGGDWGARLGYMAYNPDFGPGAPHVFAGADRLWTTGPWRYGIGLTWVDNENDVNGTRLNFDLTLAYNLSDRLYLEIWHVSHGSKLGIRRNIPNGGWNFIGIGVALDR